MIPKTNAVLLLPSMPPVLMLMDSPSLIVHNSVIHSSMQPPVLPTTDMSTICGQRKGRKEMDIYKSHVQDAGISNRTFEGPV